MPVKKVTSVMFGGPNLDILFVTSMAKPPCHVFQATEFYVAVYLPSMICILWASPEPRFAG